MPRKRFSDFFFQLKSTVYQKILLRHFDNEDFHGSMQSHQGVTLSFSRRCKCDGCLECEGACGYIELSPTVVVLYSSGSICLPCHPSFFKEMATHSLTHTRPKGVVGGGGERKKRLDGQDRQGSKDTSFSFSFSNTVVVDGQTTMPISINHGKKCLISFFLSLSLRHHQC